jgi:hypothetical protein
MANAAQVEQILDELPVSVTNPVPVTAPSSIPVDDDGGSITVDGIPELNVVNAVSAAAFNLAAAPYSATTAIATDFVLNRLEMNFSTTSARDITVTSNAGTVLWNIAADTSRDILVDFEDDAFNGGDNITVAVTQTGGACLMDVKLVATNGILSPPSPNTFTFDAEGRLETTVSGIPPIQVADKRLIFSQFLTDDGTNTGSNDMRVNGSITPVDFWVPAHATRDRYISTMFFVIADVNAAANKFGNLTALTNGCQLIYSRDDEGEVVLNPTIQTNFDVIRLTGGKIAFGDGNTAFRLNNAVGNSEGYIALLDFSLMHGMMYGLRIRAGTTTKLILRVRDDVTGVDGFTVRATGVERLPD